jgi:hypothetical protein
MAMRVVACLLLLLAAPAVQAQIYKCTEGGKTRFSDKPITDCKSQSVQGEVKAPVVEQQAAPTTTKKGKAKKKPEVPKEVAEFDRKCANLRQEHARLQRGGDEAAREQRMEAMRSEYAACR